MRIAPPERLRALPAPARDLRPDAGRSSDSPTRLSQPTLSGRAEATRWRSTASRCVSRSASELPAGLHGTTCGAICRAANRAAGGAPGSEPAVDPRATRAVALLPPGRPAEVRDDEGAGGRPERARAH